jgi:hypothetical protein
VEVAFLKNPQAPIQHRGDIADSDFPRHQPRVGTSIGWPTVLSDVAGLKAKYFDSKVINGTKKDIQLLQVDFQVKF